MVNDVIVSVFCLAYNHEKYIRKTLDGFLMQKTDFKFEVLINDDASTDSTATIIREYEKKYPDIIKATYQQQNQYRKDGHIIERFLFPNARGLYVAWCEGDDYWTNPLKLQIQVDILRKHEQCVACLSKVECVTLKGNKKKEYIPSFLNHTGIINGDRFVDLMLDPAPLNGFPIQISGLMVKKSIYEKYIAEKPSYKEFFSVGDIPLALYLGLQGDIFCIDSVMSHYRTGNLNSWMGNSDLQRHKRAAYFLKKAEAYGEFDRYTKHRYHNSAVNAIRYARFASYRAAHDLRGMKSPECSELYKLLTFKQKAAQHVFHYFPFCESFLRRARFKINALK